MSFFASVATSQIQTINFAQRMFFIVDGGRVPEMLSVMQEHKVPPHAYVEALDHIVTGCSLGNLPFAPDRVRAMRFALDDASKGNPTRRAGIKVLAKSLVRDLKTQGYTHQHIIALATEILGEVTKEIGKK